MFADSKIPSSEASFCDYSNEGTLQGGCDSKNTSPSKQKSIRTKPRGLDDETLTLYPKPIHLDVHMEDSIWGMLPEDLLCEILARIPPFIIFRLRSVCKRWNSILHNSIFFKYHTRVSPHTLYLLAFSKSSQIPQSSVFSPPLKSWQRIPFSFLPHWVAWLVGSSGGLVCFSGMDGLTFRVLVCNPLTQNWRELPRMHSNQQRQLIMVMDQSDLSFTVIGMGDAFGERALPTEIYRSKENRWILQETMPAVSLSSSKVALCNSRLYIETLSPLGLIMFSMGTGSWEHVSAKFPRSLIDGCLVPGAQNRLFLVGRIGLYSTLQGMRIWELDHGKVQWIEMSRVPPKYSRALLRSSADRFQCFGQDNMICFVSWNHGRGILHDLDKKAWSWVSGCAFRSYNSQICFYEPRFSDSII